MAGRKPETPDGEILQQIALARTPFVTSTELAEDLEMTQQGVYSRLQSLEEEELVKSRKVGARARVWWLTDAGREKMADYTSS